MLTPVEALAGLGLDRADRAPRRLGEARLRLESIKRTREEGESEALAGGSIVQRLLEYALAVVSQAPAERQFPDRREGQRELPEQGIADRKSVVEGKSESVRVDLDGLRISKKKKKQSTSTITRVHTNS